MAAPVTILVQREPGADPALPLPEYQTAGAAGADLRADLGGGELVLAPGEIRLVPTGLRVQIPDGYEMQIRPRSGLALKHGFLIPNSPGTVDSDYRGVVMCGLYYLGSDPFTIRHGDRIAQAVVADVRHCRPVEVDDLSDSERGTGGFGSTGLR